MSPRKPTHPIRRMQWAVYRYGLSRTQVERAIARDVKPLLAALERDGHGVYPSEIGGVAVMRCRHHGGCADCRLLAAWKAPLE